MNFINGIIKSVFDPVPDGMTILIGFIMFAIGIKAMGLGLKGVTDAKWLGPIDDPYKMFVVTIGLTMLWQSSSLTTALLVPLVATNQIGMLAALGGILGANIGTTITAHLAAIFGEGYHGAGRHLAFFHTYVNIPMTVIIMNPWGLKAAAYIIKKLPG